MRTRRISIPAVAACLLLLSGCRPLTLQDVPLPSLVNGPTYTVTAVFKNVLGLPQQAPVKMNGTTVGEVGSIDTVDYTARVQLRLLQSAKVPANVHAEVALSSPMGSAYVQLTAPSEAANSPILGQGDTVGLAATSQAPSVSDLLSAASTLLTGGDFADLKVIINELNAVLKGNSGNIRTVIARSSQMLTRLNQHTAQFDQALNSLHQLSSGLVHDQALLGQSLAAFAPAINTLSSERTQIFALMDRLRELSTTSAATLARTRPDMLSILSDLGPVLETLTRNQANFHATLKGIERFAGATDSALWGDYLNFNLTTIFDQTALTTLVSPTPSKAAKP